MGSQTVQMGGKVVLGMTLWVMWIILVLLSAVVVVKDRLFYWETEKLMQNLREQVAGMPRRKFRLEDLEGLPYPVQVYLQQVLQEEQPEIQCVRVKQKGRLKTAEEGKWFPLDVEEALITINPSFVWMAKLRLLPWIWISVRDIYIRCQADTRITLLSVIPLNVKGEREINQSSLLRYLSEAVLFPTALLPSPYLDWQEIDFHMAKAVIKQDSLTASAIFHFNGVGEVVKVVIGEMFRLVAENQVQEQSTLHFSDYQWWGGVKIPTRMIIEWNLEGRDFPYFEGKIVSIEYNRF